MSRMTREFSLVLLGAGILTAGYFVAPSPDLEAKADEQASERLTGDRTSGTYHRTGFYPLFFVHSYGYTGSTTNRPATASAGSSRGGFGGTGRAASGGG